LGGVIYTLTHLAALWRRARLRRLADALAERIPALAAQDDGLDLIAGSAGCIAALLGTSRGRLSPAVRAAVVACGDRLLAQARPVPTGIGWVSTHMPSGPWTGFAHGAAGF